MTIDFTDPQQLLTVVGAIAMIVLKVVGGCALASSQLPPPETDQVVRDIEAHAGSKGSGDAAALPTKRAWTTNPVVSYILRSWVYRVVYRLIKLGGCNLRFAKNLNDPAVQKGIVAVLTTSAAVLASLHTGVVSSAVQVAANAVDKTQDPANKS